MPPQGALKKRTDYGAAFAASGVTTYYCSSKGCNYQGHVSIDFVWKAVMKDDRIGLKVRWAFLGMFNIIDFGCNSITAILSVFRQFQS